MKEQHKVKAATKHRKMCKAVIGVFTLVCLAIIPAAILAVEKKGSASYFDKPYEHSMRLAPANLESGSFGSIVSEDGFDDSMLMESRVASRSEESYLESTASLSGKSVGYRFQKNVRDGLLSDKTKGDFPKKRMIMKDGSLQLDTYADTSAIKGCTFKSTIANSSKLETILTDVKAILGIKNTEAYINSEKRSSQQRRLYCGKEHPDENLVLRKVYLTAMVPFENFETIIEKLSNFKGVEVVNPSTSAREVTNQYIDTVARISVLEATKRGLEKLMESAKSVDDVLKVEKRLREVLNDIESNMRKSKLWEKGTAFSTIVLIISENLPEYYYGENQKDSLSWSPYGTLEKALSLLLDKVGVVSMFLIDVLIYATVFLGPILVLYLLFRMISSSRRRTKTNSTVSTCAGS
mmetsp:Transcript_4152/g.5217  ORF Transcript_4152/g.5217 Transcript_4152/m.5217 type:complete len:408 (+) Transcript_4152:316-1539(+)